MKKIIAIAMILTLALGTFVACSSEESGDGASEGQSNNQGSGEEIVLPEFATPNESGAPDDLKAFETVGLDGVIYNQEIFVENVLTVVNVWGTYCPPCLEEMPFLGELSREYEESDKNIRILGLVIDTMNPDFTVNEDNAKTAVEIVRETDAAYSHIMISPNIQAFLNEYPVSAVPSTFFLDANGNIVGEPVVGALSKEAWKKVIDQRYEEME